MLDISFLAHTFVLSLAAVPVTLKITLVSLAVGLILGFFTALARIYRIRVLSGLSAVFVSFIRGTPMVLQILVVYSLLPSVLHVLFLKAGIKADIFALNPVWYAYFVFSLNTTAILSEVLRSALLTVHKGQIEAALTIGMTAGQAYRRIIIPQALTAALPNICTATVNLIKNTSLAFMMTVKDITAVAKIEAAYGYNYIEAYLDIFVIYIIVCVIVQKVFAVIEKRLCIYRQPGVSYAGN